MIGFKCLFAISALCTCIKSRNSSVFKLCITLFQAMLFWTFGLLISGPKLYSYQKCMHCTLFLDHGIFGVPLHTLMEQDQKIRPTQTVPMVFEDVSTRNSLFSKFFNYMYYLSSFCIFTINL